MLKLILAGVLLLGGVVKAEEAGGHAAHVMVASPEELVWGPAPPGLPPGSKLAVLTGNPAAAGPYTIRAWMPDGYKVPPHWHPTDENLTVLSGTLHAGMGDTFEPAKAAKLGPGSFVVMEKQMRHWVWTEGDTVLQIHGTGPFSITYVNPADDPRQPKPDVN
ncbi:MAG TPA: cupin domain-containing protein [Thermoanaerobaculia bacterium]|jgi:mannose-6-phosphate isomerase-like protein (cupin superfamily)|nr:cupin domain-containing protein [Thermoanaerobaculia bacterium]